MLKVAVIGVGSLGQHHARVYHQQPDVELVAVVDSNLERATGIARQYGCAALTSLDDLGPVDAVSVVVPTIDHCQVAVNLFERGVHCLVEKPIAMTRNEAELICRTAAEHNCVLQIGHIERFNPAVVALARVLGEPLFIECHRLGPPAPRVQDIGVVMDLMIHDLDLILTLVKSEVVSLDAIGVPVLMAQEDIANARLHFSSGCVANVTASRITPGRQRKMRFFQRDAYISLDFLAPSLHVYRKTDRPGLGGFPIDYRQEAIEEREPLLAELTSFLEAVRGEHPPVVTGEDGVRALCLAETITQTITNQLDAYKGLL